MVSLLWVFVAGDNMLTALSVAKECKMVAKGDKIVQVEASPLSGQLGLPQIQFVYEGQEVKSSRDISIEKVYILDTIYHCLIVYFVTFVLY